MFSFYSYFCYKEERTCIISWYAARVTLVKENRSNKKDLLIKCDESLHTNREFHSRMFFFE